MTTGKTESQCVTVSVDEAAKILGISRSSAFKAARSGGIRALRFGRRLRVPRIEIDRLLQGDEVVTP